MSGSISSLYLTDPEAASALRRQRLAEALMQQGKEPMTHPLQVAGHWAQALVGALMSRRSDEELKQLGERRRADRTSFMNDITGALGGGAQSPQASGLGAPPVSLAPNIAPAGGSASASGGASPSPELKSLYQQHAQRTGIPAELLMAQGQQESGFNPNIVGRAGEVGLGQIKPSTAASPGFGVAPVDPSKLTDPATNIGFQADYLAGRGRAAGVTDWTQPDQQARALRAYNGGGDPQYAQHVMGRMAGFGGATSPAATPVAGQARDAVSGGQPDATAVRDYNEGQPRQGGVDTATMRRMAVRAAMSDDPHIQSLAGVLAQFAAKDAPRSPVSVAPGSSLVDPATGRPIYTAPPAPRDRAAEPLERVIGPDGQPTLVPRGEASGRTPFVPERQPTPLMPPDVMEQQRQLREAGRPATSIDMRAETSEAQGRGRSLAEEGDRVRTGAEAAAAMLDTVRHVRSIGADTDRLAPMKEAVGGWLNALGVSGGDLVKQATNVQQFNAAAANFVLGKQLEQKGVQSESDAKRMRDTFASITNTREANDFILRSTEAQANRSMDRGQFYLSWRQQHNGSVDGANEAWTRFIRDTPMVGKTAEGQPIFLNEWLPMAMQYTKGNQDEALKLWREGVGRR